GGIFRRELNVLAKRFGEANGVAGLLQALIAREPQLVLQMNIRGCEKHMDAGMSSVLKRFPGALDVKPAGPSQSGDDGAPDHSGNRLYRFKVAIGSDGEPGFNHIHTQAIELVRQTQLFLLVHAATGRLLSVS